MLRDKERSRAYYLKNKERMNAESIAYYQANKKRLNKLRAARYHENKDPTNIFMVDYKGVIVKLSNVWAKSNSNVSYPTVLAWVRDKKMSIDEALTKQVVNNILNRKPRKKSKIADMQELNNLWK